MNKGKKIERNPTKDDYVNSELEMFTSERGTSSGVDFMHEDPRGLIEEKLSKPEDAIPDLPENTSAREFLKSAPSKGLWLPMGMEVKVMQCWRCKAYGHRTGDRECPMSAAGNIILDAERQAREDPMARYVATKTGDHQDKYERRRELELLMEEIREEERLKKKRKKEKKKGKSSKKEKKRKTHKY